MASVSSSTSTLSNLSAKTGIGGLVSGMDIDELVEQLSATSRQKILKQKQNVQKLEWKQTAYRSVTSGLTEFQSKYLDVLSSTNFRRASFFNTIKPTSSSEAVTAVATGSSSAGTITINSITQLATSQKITMADNTVASKALKGTKTIPDIISGLTAGESISLSLDGKVKTITFDAAFVSTVTPATFETKLQTLIDDAFGVTDPLEQVIKVDVGADDMLTFSAPGSTLILSTVGGSYSTLGDLGFTGGQTNKLATNIAVKDLSFANALDLGASSYDFKINGESFSFSKNDTLATIIDKINRSDAGVTLSYSSITDRFTMTADETGAGDNIVISETNGNLMTAFGLTDAASAKVTAGENAILSVNGQSIVRNSNTIIIDDVKVTLNETSAEEITLTMKDDATSLLDTVKKFVEDYNSMITLMNGLVKEDLNSDYQPLSEEQKADMSETEIASWEKKAKSGVVRGDSLLKSISSKIHSVMTGLSVNGTSLYSMGISSAGYKENGKLQIDETKLKAALETKGSEIRELFTSEDGIGNVLDGIITDATKTSGVKGSRGTLVEVAGVDSTMSDTENSIFEQIKRINKNVTNLQSRLTDEETRLWNKFTAMETAINRLNSQSSILSQFSGSSS